MQQITFSIPSHLGFIPGVRTALGRISYNFGFNDKDAYEIETVIDEICNNAIMHGSREKDDHITIECKFDTKIIEIMVKDSGTSAYDVDEILENSKKIMEADTVRNLNTIINHKVELGLIIVQQYVDKLEIKTQPDGTVVKLTKYGHSVT
jgi:serine/threonine-protein kinase RsbW